ncbi:L-type lectin-domain containing protein [Companilactobacillus hulinensis]|uniref:L-type lectin-domain containing protein n=1 Tax=Companilactobacillus hulinensis TaxID=2486007 RepID=UPI000F7A97AC|nr:L-type lectin-domain containing protein [Companilactobacillus hulinensis]
MKNENRRDSRLYFWLIIIIFFGALFVEKKQEVFAATVLPVDSPPADAEDLQHALDTAPRGMDILTESFIQGKFYKTNDKNKLSNLNASKVIHRNQNDLNDRTGILRVTHGNNQLGSIWSNIDGNNYFDVTRHQTMSMWMYFGREKDPVNPNSVGDGMAFVLQNDPRGVDAISSFKGNPAYGETLGVWGADFNNSTQLPTSEIAKTAIQKSFAIEFDTYLNKKSYPFQLNGEGVSFDIDKNSKHIAMNYPDSPLTYEAWYTPASRDRKYYFKMMHKSAKESMKMTDANWHHITMKWEPRYQSLYMSYDDKNLDGTRKPTFYEWNQQIDISHFDLKNSNKLRWGFTGSTGGQMENSLIVFESIPSFVSGDAHAAIRNNTKNKLITDEDFHVDADDDLSFIYNLNYQEGSKDWENILADINLPEEVEFTSGTIIYEDDTDDPEIISLSEVNGNNVQHILNKHLSDKSKHAIIELHARVKPVANATMVPSSHARFESDNLIADTDTPKFYIDTEVLRMTMNPDGTLEYSSMSQLEDQIHVQVEVHYMGGQTIYPKNITLYSEIVGANQQSAKTLQGPPGDTAPFDLYIDKKNLKVGQNTIKVYAKNFRTKWTKTHTIIINIGGALEFGNIQQDVFFKPIHVDQPEQGRLIPRQNGWQVEVVDGRPSGVGWTLQAQADDMIDKAKNQKLNGNMIHRDEDGNIKPLGELTNIYSNVKHCEEVETIDVAGKWSEDSGILLQLNDQCLAGNYNGLIHWNLVDSVQ